MAVLAKVEEQLNKAPNLKGMFQLDVVQERAIKNYEGTTGRKDGQNRFESEVFAYMELMAEKPDLAKLDRFQHFKAIVKVMTMGLTLRDQKVYVMPGKNNTIKVQSSPAGKREMMERMPEIMKFPQANVVYKGDLFRYDYVNKVVLQHESTDKSPDPDKVTLDQILFAYQRIYWKSGPMLIEDVLVDKTKLIAAKNKSTMKSGGPWFEFPADMCRKVATNVAFTLYHKYPDNVVEFDKGEDTADDTTDVEHAVVDTQAEPQQPEQPVQQATVVNQKKDDFLDN